ncbi:GMC family oxidoreductase [Ruegeria arenilitoris]|uniref:GMC family oxidoreductase n=1 Tax=Ruegeria arenilitoris TaxID=1173585 RepID=UPI001581901A|nr:GMC family oxidoreductase [Ruegeria arenilitoris]
MVIGSGVAGALTASELASQGLRVVIFETGPRIERSDAYSKFLSAAVKDLASPYPADTVPSYKNTTGRETIYRQTGPQSFQSDYLKAVGGTTWHWLGSIPRFLPQDFKLRTTYGLGEDWPLSYEVLEPYYGWAERELGASGDSNNDRGSPRSSPYPMPPIPQSYLDQKAAAALTGSPYEFLAAPQARNSISHADRPACCGSASCIPLCPIQAKYDATVHVAKAEAAGAVLFPETTATMLHLDEAGIIKSVEYRRSDGTSGHARSKIVVLAANGIETPRLMLNSAQERAPGGLANSSDQVGRNLMDHPVKLSWAMAPEPVWPFRGPLITSTCDTLRDGAFRSDHAALLIEIGNQGQAWSKHAPFSNVKHLIAKGLRGPALDQAIFDATSRQIEISSMVEQLPVQENRVTLDPDRRDENGMPEVSIFFSIDPYTKAGLKAAEAAHTDIFSAMGASEIGHDPAARGAGHIMGTVRMGTDPKTAVLDENLRSFDTTNLFVVGSAVFPSGGTANPTLTIAALALRASEAISAQLAQMD